MNATPDTWKCSKCGRSYIEQKDAEQCCQPPPKPPMDFAALRGYAEAMPVNGTARTAAEAIAVVEVRRQLQGIIDLAERCETAEKERERLKAEVTAIKSSTGRLTTAENNLVEYCRVNPRANEQGLIAIIDQLKSAAPTLNWRKDIPARTPVVYAVRPTDAWEFGYGRAVDAGVETQSWFTWWWKENILAIPYDELAATLPGGS